MTLDDAIAKLPLIAVLRGIAPEEAEPVGKVLLGAGFTVMEVPLNSPKPYRSIRIQAENFGEDAIVGAGTVLYAEQVSRVADSGGKIVVSPNFNEEVVRATKRLGLISIPGVFTPSEAFRALDAGADGLKLFPGDGMSPAVVKAMRAVLPKGTRLFVTGGVSLGNIAEWMQGGVDGLGIGSALFKHGKSLEDIAADAAAFCEATVSARAAQK